MPSKCEDNVRAVIFDMDGTLLNSMIYWRGENECFLERRGLPMPEEYKNSARYLSSRYFSGLMIERYHLPMTVKEAMEEYQREMVKHYQNEVQPKKGAERYLKYLAARGVKTCVATASPKPIAEPALARHGLIQYLEFVTDLNEIGMEKDDPRFYGVVMNRLGVTAEETVMFEDSYYAMVGAKAAGLRVYGIEDRVHLADPELMRDIRAICDTFVRDFDELMEE